MKGAQVNQEPKGKEEAMKKARKEAQVNQEPKGKEEIMEMDLTSLLTNGKGRKVKSGLRATMAAFATEISRKAPDKRPQTRFGWTSGMKKFAQLEGIQRVTYQKVRVNLSNLGWIQDNGEVTLTKEQLRRYLEDAREFGLKRSEKILQGALEK